MRNYFNSHFKVREKPIRRSSLRGKLKTAEKMDAKKNNSVHAAKTSLANGLRERRNGRCRLNANGRKTQDWIKVRRELSIEFAAAGITSCELKYEGCWGEKALGWAHGRKRRNLRDGELKSLVALVCNPCHGRIEYLPPEEMLAIVQDVIARREEVAA